MRTVIIATRESPLALWQAKFVQTQLAHHHPLLRTELKGITTQADRAIDVSLAKIGGKGLFVKELEQALLEKRADIAVHSLKDVPPEVPEGLSLHAILKRAAVTDLLISRVPLYLNHLPKHLVVGTSSLRRQAQLLRLYPHLTIKPLRGNVNTRLQKLYDGQYDAIVLAQAGIERLNISVEHAITLPLDTHLPAAGQGALVVECRSDDHETQAYLNCLHDPDTATLITAERALIRHLKGDCKTPIAAYAHFEADHIRLTGVVTTANGARFLHHTATHTDPLYLGKAIAEQLITQGACDIIRFTRKQTHYRIVNTRPVEHGHSLEKKLNHLGFDVFSFPTIVIEACTPQPIQGQYDLAIFISRSAVTHGMQHIRHLKIKSIAAIGAGTRSALQEAGLVCDICPDTFHSDALLSLLDNIPLKRVLIMKGEDGNPQLTDTLKARGIIVDHCNVYRRVLPHYEKNVIDAALAPHTHPFIISTSLQSLENLNHLLSCYPDKRDFCLLVISDNMLSYAKTLGFHTLIQAENASDESIIAALQKEFYA